MDEHISYQGNPETRGTTLFHVFEDTSAPPPPGTKARPRPADRPREMPPDDLLADDLQSLEDEKPSETEGTQPPAQPDESDQ